ncbi:DUF736 family protein [Jannaschia sp. CCS1]|uniref:DUF736 family protein n=1 Tax=Jannaschia sp. (strain CCS1) TaxID=290400 RepID=UPI000053C419|nr:DUF736 family protein [Jannaschia sp. CCS1]ABD57136.1 ParB-like nuclease [Jannaschia sp. CCS1]
MTQAHKTISVAIGALTPHPANVRANSSETYDSDSIAHLKASIAILGLIQPLLVQKLDGKYGVLASGRRHTALNELVADKAAKGFSKRTKSADDATTVCSGIIHSAKFDIAIQLERRAKMSERSSDYDITTVNKSGRKVGIGTAWNETGQNTGNHYVSMQIDVSIRSFRVNAVPTQEACDAETSAFDIISLVSNGVMKFESILGELTAMDADNAFTGYIANMMFDLDFMLIENGYKTEESHPDYRIEIRSLRGTPIRVGSAWMAKSAKTGNEYLSLLINTPDGDLRVNAIQNDEQRGGQAFSIIPFIDKLGSTAVSQRGTFACGLTG